MSAQSQLFPDPPPQSTPARVERSSSGIVPGARSAPVWLQRVSLCVLVLFCLYIGALLAVLPWWRRVWDDNFFFLAHPQLSAFVHLGAVRGIISGLGLLDIWIGISEAVHYRDHRGTP